MERDQVIAELQERYTNKKLIPFIGAGLSVPFNLPKWDDLVTNMMTLVPEKIRPAIESDLEIGEYQIAVDDIKRFARCSEQTIQEIIADLYDVEYVKDKDRPDSNYLDLLRGNFGVYLTTNYDRILEWYLPEAKSFSCLQEYTSNTHRLFSDSKNKNIFHVHGSVNNPSTIVISSESYNSLYENQIYDDMMKAFSSSCSYLFLGFSFNDVFIRNLLKNHRGIYKGNHYLVISKRSIEEKNLLQLNEEFGIKVVEYDSSKLSHLIGIREILNDITKSPIKNKLQTNKVQIGTNFEDLQKAEVHKGNLFYKKLNIANINPKLMKLSTYFYIAAEKFIRESQKLGFPKEYIDNILVEVFLRYQEKYTLLYDLQNKDSNEVLIAIHEDLKEINIDRYKEAAHFNPMISETQGLIHVLADDSKKDVWWGSERFEEPEK
jgi:hypothetical protein